MSASGTACHWQDVFVFGQALTGILDLSALTPYPKPSLGSSWECFCDTLTTPLVAEVVRRHKIINARLTCTGAAAVWGQLL